MPVIEIDGSVGEGGGQILRTSITLASVLGKRIRISKIRAGRKQPGLRPQHLQAVLAATKISGGDVHGASVGSTEIEFSPAKIPKRYAGVIDTGTAGSIPLIAQTIIPISIFGGVELDVEIVGGTEVPNSPSFDYLSRIVVPVYSRLGGRIDLGLKRRGYYPRGGGSVILRSSKIREPASFELDAAMQQDGVNILSVSRSLPPHVAQRQADIAMKKIELEKLKVNRVEIDSAGDSLSPGSSILVYTGDLTTKFVGATSLGERGKRAELVGEDAANNFLEEEKTHPAVDSHLADMLVTLLSLVPGRSSFTTSFLTDHFSTNCLVAEKLTGCKVKTEKSGALWHVEIVGLPEKPN